MMKMMMMMMMMMDDEDNDDDNDNNNISHNNWRACFNVLVLTRRILFNCRRKITNQFGLFDFS